MSGGGRDAVKMVGEEYVDFLASNIKVQIACNGRDGVPHLSTLFYTLVDTDRIAFWTYGASQKIRNLERDPRVSALVEDGVDYFELRGASITGHAQLIRDPARILEIGTDVAVRMLGVESADDLGDFGRETVAKQATKRIAVIVHPERVATWDHRKMV